MTGERCLRHRGTPGAVILRRRASSYDVCVMTAHGRQRFTVDGHDHIHWPHPAAVPRRLKRLAEHAYRQKQRLDRRIC